MLDFVPTIALATMAILVGFVGLIWSADRFVAGAASIAEAFGIAPVIIGLTIVSFGTSAPEVMVSLIAAIEGSGDLAVGNAIGSNIANIGLVLGVTTLICLIPVQTHLLKQEGAVLMAITLVSGAFLYDARISALEGWLLLGMLIPSMAYLTIVKQRSHSPEELVDDEVPHYSTGKAITWFLVGLLTLIFSSKILVWGAETTALHFNVSPLIIGLTIVAIGTSLPELAASVMSALRGHHDIAVGNIVGSNIFNLLAVMSLPGIFGTAGLDGSVFSRDYITMLALTTLLIACIVFALFAGKKSAQLGRVSGGLLLSLYIGYMILLARSQF